MILPLLLKALLTGGIVAAAAVGAARLGPVWGGLIATLPTSAAPAFILLGLAHPPEFVAQAAATGLASNIATALYLFLLVRGLPRLGLWRGMALAVPGWAVAAGLMTWLAPGYWMALVLNVLAYGLAIQGTAPALVESAPVALRPAAWWELPLRAALLGLVVASVVSAAGGLGPMLTGFATMFPVALTSLTIAAVPRMGVQGTARLLAGATRGMLGFIAFMAVLAGLAPVLGALPAVGCGLVAALSWGAGVLLLRARRA
ncbi:hypothetical protein EOD42_02450 [Rhodovarius crocodyli]|uniref:DUF3147 family protein n=1 Tax=Rhodovarius crocodyli TaxID=1979269 RepID=A0A437MMW6_9PROT|nr:hypothetical protein [Rhodovarius crocodyli]RVT98991.1 hypothetical protein EOD42_02450 [Rhodovarius crocodyli]